MDSDQRPSIEAYAKANSATHKEIDKGFHASLHYRHGVEQLNGKISQRLLHIAEVNLLPNRLSNGSRFAHCDTPRPGSSLVHQASTLAIRGGGRNHIRVIIAMLMFVASSASAQLSPETESKIAAIANDTLKQTGVPSASIAIAIGDRLVYAQAFGYANINSRTPATIQMAYPIGSISKQFTATAALLLQQDGKLSLDDKVGKYFPELSRANEVTLRNLMTMTSGYADFSPQDYLVPAWLKPVDPLANVHEWAGKPLDFSPGTEWQYSNTNYALLGLILQKASGIPLEQFIRERILTPLHLEDVFNPFIQRDKLEVTGYVSNALSAPHVVPLKAQGWTFAAGDLAMTASTLIDWDLALMRHALLSPESYKEMETAFVFPSGPKAGQSSGYGLGIFISDLNGHRMLEHSGEVGGYVSEDVIFPEDKIAIVALTNEANSRAAGRIATAISQLLDPGTVASPPVDPLEEKLRTILTGMQSGQIDRSLFTDNCNFYFTPDTLADFESTLAPLGKITEVKRTRTLLRGGMIFGRYEVTFANGTTLRMSTYLKSDGKIEQLLIDSKV